VGAAARAPQALALAGAAARPLEAPAVAVAAARALAAPTVAAAQRRAPEASAAAPRREPESRSCGRARARDRRIPRDETVDVLERRQRSRRARWLVHVRGRTDARRVDQY